MNQWINFHQQDPRTFPIDNADVEVETQSGQIFPARFNQKTADFSLFYVLWGKQGAVTRWRYRQEKVNGE